MDLSVNIDHIATLRNARGENYPDPVQGAVLVETAGGHGITLHVREDRRHVNENDLARLKTMVSLPINLEMAPTDAMVELALKHRPHRVTFVPEKRRELTTEGGLKPSPSLAKAIKKLEKEGIEVSFFLDPDPKTIKQSAELGIRIIEIHTGPYARAFATHKVAMTERELDRLFSAAEAAHDDDLRVHAGHGLNHLNLAPVCQSGLFTEVSIGHALLGRALFIGLAAAVRELLDILQRETAIGGGCGVGCGDSGS